MKKIVSIVLVVLMLLAMVPAVFANTAFAAEEDTKEETMVTFRIGQQDGEHTQAQQ